jgi:hypothetical protein
MPLVPSAERRYLADLVGWRFLEFVCNTTDGDLRAHLSGDLRLDPSQERSLEAVLAVAAESAALGVSLGVSQRLGLHSLIHFQANLDTTPAVHLRYEAGGAPVVIDAANPLAVLARDLFPALLLNPVEQPHQFPHPFLMDEAQWLSPTLSRHPAREAFEAVVRADAALMRLYPREDSSGPHGFISYSTGEGRGAQLVMLSYDVLIAAYQGIRMRDEVEHAAFVDQALRNLDVTRRLIEGQEVGVAARVALVGLEISDETRFELPFGTLRRPTDGERAIIAGGPTERTQEVVIETTFPLRATVQDPRDSEAIAVWHRSQVVAYEELMRNVDLARLSVLLALDRQPLAGSTQTWTLIENPAGQHPTLRWMRDTGPIHVHQLAAADSSDVLEWAARVAEFHHPSIAVATHRTLSAAALRDDPADGLIDAVIALENLFGGPGELRFRISTACAYLLEPNDAERRRERQRRVKRIYDARSNVVHGEAPGPSSETEAWRTQAVDTAVTCLRALFSRRPDVLADGQGRAMRLILDGPEAPSAIGSG